MKVTVEYTQKREAVVLYSIHTGSRTSVHEVLSKMTNVDNVIIQPNEEILVIRVSHQ